MDTHAEARELAVPRSGYPGLVFGLKGVYRTLGQGQLTLAVFSVDVPRSATYMLPGKHYTRGSTNSQPKCQHQKRSLSARGCGSGTVWRFRLPSTKSLLAIDTNVTQRPMTGKTTLRRPHCN